VPATAQAQVEATLERGRSLLARGQAEQALLVLEAAADELADQPSRAAEARFALAETYAALDEPDEHRAYLSIVAADSGATLELRRRAEAALAQLDETPAVSEPGSDDGEYAQPFDDPATIGGVVFMALEVGALIAGGVLFAESNCVDDPMPCDATTRHVSIGLLVGGSIWWIVPTVLIVGVLAFGSAAARSARRDDALFRF